MPKVSVIIPNYNHSTYLKERIDSVLNQTFQDFEVIILDDFSTDNSRSIIDIYRNHPRISHIIFNETNSGSTFKQWNKGIGLATGEWIWIAESDDVAENNFLETLINGVERDKETVLGYCQSLRMNKTGEITGSWLTQTTGHDTDFSDEIFSSGENFIRKDLIKQNVIPNASAVLFKKNMAYLVNLVDEDIKYNSDWLFWMKLILNSKIYFCPLPLNYFRYHEKSVIASAKKQNSIPFRKKFDILMMLRFLSYLKNTNHDNLTEIVRQRISNLNEEEFKFLLQKKIKKKAFTYFIAAIKTSSSPFLLFKRNLKFTFKHLCFP
ncbi:glycosyltransferase family 2 protein [Chryseobacterium sp. 2R14A]|uniref:glycosyltransferase family 2 protein n=1 Tax=Chryseobacterium sp. 2R14A TaxID=3380353 RepID=UPI003CEB5529